MDETLFKFIQRLEQRVNYLEEVTKIKYRCCMCGYYPRGIDWCLFFKDGCYYCSDCYKDLEANKS